MNDDIIVNEEVEEQVEEVKEEVEVKAEEPKTRFDDWDRDTAVKNYQELEKFNSRQAQELGQLRKTADEFIQKPSQETPIDLDSLLDNPTDAINQSLQSNPEIQKLQSELQNIQNQTAVTTLKSKHPDFMDIYQDPSFQNWAADNPVRQRLLNDANNYDVEAADFLFSDWKSHTSVSQKQAEDNVRLEKAKADITKVASEGAGGKSANKVYSRADLAELKVRNFDKYEAMWPEILKAYQEKRVR